MKVLGWIIGVFSSWVILFSSFVVYVGIIEPTIVSGLATMFNCITLFFLCVIYCQYRIMK